MARTWRLGTRGSLLARTQSGHVAALIEAATGDRVELVIVRTRGDAVQDRPLAAVGGKGLFTKELEEGLLGGEIDLAVHSLKDLPSENPPGLVVAGLPPREDPRDVLVGSTLADLRRGAVVGTGSARRAMQLLALRPDLEIRGLRGNVDTRIAKQRAGDYDAIVLAAAGITRIGRAADITDALDVDHVVPAVGQGTLAVQCREDDAALRAILERLSDRAAVAETALERAFLEALGGGCSVPAACHARLVDDRLEVRAFLGRDDGASVRDRGACDTVDGPAYGAALALRLKTELTALPPR
jgi:hydroxymethylbilane synthase